MSTKTLVLEDLMETLATPATAETELAPVTELKDLKDEGAKNFIASVEKQNQAEVEKFKSL